MIIICYQYWILVFSSLARILYTLGQNNNNNHHHVGLNSHLVLEDLTFFNLSDIYTITWYLCYGMFAWSSSIYLCCYGDFLSSGETVAGRKQVDYINKDRPIR